MSEDPRTVRALALTSAQQEYLRHLVHHRVVAHPPATRALFLAPHPDDIVLGCGGTLPKMLAGGVEVRLAYLTDGRAAAPPDGDRDGMAARREAEARRVAGVLGLAEPEFFRVPEPEFPDPAREGELTRRLSALLGAMRPDAVFLPYLFDQHRDHRYTNHVLARALEAGGFEPTVVSYEVWAQVPPGLVVDVSATYATKRELIDCYPSQLELLDYHRLCDTVGRLHAPLAGPAATHAEVFWPTPAESYCRLVRDVDLASPASLATDVLLTPPDDAP